MRRSLLLAWCLAAAACSQGPTPSPQPTRSGSGGAASGLIAVDPLGCAGSDGTPSAAAGAPGLDPLCSGTSPEISYAQQVAPLVSCTGEVCHQAWSYQSLVGKASTACCDHRPLVDPGRPSSSHLVQAVSGSADSCVGRMGALGDAQVATIIAWICEGAPND